MSLTLTAAPAVEPITLGEAKAFAKIDGDHDDALVTSLIATSRQQIEAALDLALVTQSWTFSAPAGPARTVDLPLHPVQAVDAVRHVPREGQQTVIEPSNIEVDAARRPVRLTLPPFAVGGRIEIDFVAGFGATPEDVPWPIRHAVKLLVAHWHENREPALIGSEQTRIPEAVSALLAPYRWVKL